MAPARVPIPGAPTGPTRFVLRLSDHERPRIFNLFDGWRQETTDRRLAFTCVCMGTGVDTGKWVAYVCSPDEVEYVQ